MNATEELRDVVYYKRKKSVDVTEMYDIDSQENFMRFATDHYGELGLSRLNIFASNDRQQGWKIVVSNSYLPMPDWQSKWLQLCIRLGYHCRYTMRRNSLEFCLKTMPSIHTVRYTGSKGRFCHSWVAWFNLFKITTISLLETNERASG